MLAGPLTNDASICLRCQYRLLSHKNLRKRRQISSSLTQSIRSFAYFACLHQEQMESKPEFQHIQDPLSTTESQRLLRRHSWRRLKLHTKESLDVESLGKTSKIIKIRGYQPRKISTINDKLEESDEASRIMSPSEILALMNEERGLVNARRVAANIAQIKSRWLSTLQDRSGIGIASVSEYNAVAKSLMDGFTQNQLSHYYLAESSDMSLLSNAAEISSPSSTDLYTRSSWRLGSTEFPGNASSELQALRAQLDQAANNPSKSIDVIQKTQETSTGRSTKRVIVDKILREKWNIQTDIEREMAGEVDLWMHREHLDLMLNHRSNMLRWLAQKYGVKIDAALTHGIIRITGDIGTCGDVFRFLVYTLENISSVEIAISSEQSLYGQALNQEHRPINQSLKSQIEQLTSTVLRPVLRNETSSKLHETLRVYYLGPQQDDLEDVQRLLSQKNLPSSIQRESTFWEGTRDLSQVAPCLVETDQGLPLVERGTQWSRWRTGMNMEFKVCEKAKDRLFTTINRWKIFINPPGNNFMKSISPPDSDPEKQSGVFWEKSPMVETAAVFGYVLFPFDLTKKTKQKLDVHHANVDDPEFLNMLRSHRQFSSAFPGLGVLVSPSSEKTSAINFSKAKSYQGLRIRLVPSENDGMPAGSKFKLPDLELRLDIDKQSKETTLAGARLIIDRRQVDVLLPEQISDIRLLTKLYIPSDSRQIDPQIADFLQSSNLDTFGQSRLKTPITLSMSIPRHLVQDASKPTSPKTIHFLEPGSDIIANYAFYSLEHRSSISIPSPNSEFQYSIIEAGKSGGRRIEARLVLRDSSSSFSSSSSSSSKDQFSKFLQDIKGSFERFRERRKPAITPPTKREAISEKATSATTKQGGSHYLYPNPTRDVDKDPILRKVKALPTVKAQGPAGKS